jgi:hypothetical protein
MQTVHGVPLPIYRGFQLLADAGDVVLPSTTPGGAPFNQSSPLTTFATKNTTTNTLHIFLSNFAPDDGKAAAAVPTNTALIAAAHAHGNDGIDSSEEESGCNSTANPNPCTNPSCYLPRTDFEGGDLLPESNKFKTPNASACCEACVNFPVDKFCQAWVWKEASGVADPTRCDF